MSEGGQSAEHVLSRGLFHGLFRGHPPALLFILLCQSGFEFSITGMRSIAVLYTGTYLFQPHTIDRIIGFGPLRTVLMQFGSATSPAALASLIFGVAGAFAYLTPLVGGFISDRLMRRSQAVLLGGACCVAGELLIGLPASFLIGLGLVLVGSGFVGVNIATQLGDLYAQARGDLADAFQAIHLCRDVAAVAGALVCGGLAQGIAWHWGFVAAAGGMLLGLGAYVTGWRLLPAEPARLPAGGVAAAPPDSRDGRTVAALLALLPALVLVGLANGQIANAYLVWGSAVYRLQAFGRAIPASWLVAADNGFSVLASIAILAFWHAWARRRRLPNDLSRLAAGAFIAATAPLLLALASAAALASGQRVGLGWAVGFHTLDNLGVVAVGPVAGAIFARMAPRRMAALMMGILNANACGSALAVGFLGTLLPRLGGTRFWLLQAGLVAAGGVLLVLLRVTMGGLFRIRGATVENSQLVRLHAEQ